MTDEPSVFAATAPDATPADPATPQLASDVQATLDKFGNDMTKLAEGKTNSDKFITKLEGELEGLRGELDNRMTAEQVLEEINKSRPQNEEDTTPQISATDISELVAKEVKGLETAKASQKNVDEVETYMKTTFGADKASEQISAKASEIGVNVDYLLDIASKSPKAFYSVMEIEQGQPQSTSQVNQGSVNTEALVNTAPAVKEGTYDFYEALRKSNPKEYWKAATQNKMHKEAEAAGAGFYN